MARKASEVTFLKTAPRELPDGIETVEVKRTLRSQKPEGHTGDFKAQTGSVILTLDVPVVNGEGVIAYPAFYSENSGEENGPEFAAEAIRNAIANAAAAKIALGSEGQSRHFVPPIAALRVVDKGEMVGQRLADWTRENPGKMPSAEVLKQLYAGIV